MFMSDLSNGNYTNRNYTNEDKEAQSVGIQLNRELAVGIFVSDSMA